MALLNNYLSPFGQVRLFNTKTQEDILLWAGRSGQQQQKYPFVTGITVVMQVRRTSQISFNIDAPYKEGKEFLEEDWLALNNVVAVRMGYSGTQFVTPWFYG